MRQNPNLRVLHRTHLAAAKQGKQQKTQKEKKLCTRIEGNGDSDG
jgi:hypothetical protein